MSKKALGIDWGKKMWGIALAINEDMIQPLPAIPARSGRVSQETIAALIEQWQPSDLVIGLPLNMDGTEQPVSRHVRKQVAWLQTWLKIPVHLQDERMTTKEAKKILSIHKTSEIKKNKGKIDSTAAVLILESWFLSKHAL